MAKLHNKRLTGIEGDLSTIAIRWTCQGVLYLHLKLHFGVLTLIRDSTDDFPLFYNFMFANTTLLKGAGGLEDSQIIYTLRLHVASGANNCYL